MLNQLQRAVDRYEQLSLMLEQADIVSDPTAMANCMKELKTLTPIAEKFQEYKAAESNLQQAQALYEDASLESDLRELALAESLDLKKTVSVLTEELKVLLLPVDPHDSRSAVVEIRAGAGGEEAALFAADLYRMYCMYAASVGFKTELVSENETELGGYREISFLLTGEGVYSRMKFESGVHRVQRVPKTETQGRIHTSTVSVAVLPEAEEVEVTIDPSELHFESIKSTGAGGQHVNKTESAVRLTHIPSGIVIECRNERSQFQNKDKALKMLRAKLLDIKQREQNDSIANARRTQIGTADRSEKIRTYNFPQSRITDHRIGFTAYSLDSFMDGDISSLIDSLRAAETAEKLAQNSGDALC